MAYRAGLLLTAPGIVSLDELGRLMPEGVQPVIATILMSSVTPEGVAEYERGVEYVARQLALGKVDCVIQITVSAALSGRRETPDEMAQKIRSVVDVPVVIAARASANALKFMGIRRPIVVGAFNPLMLERLRQLFIWEGVEPFAAVGAGMEHPNQMHSASSDQAFHLALDAARAHPGGDGIWIGGGGWPILDRIHELEQLTNLPVVASNTALIWELQRLSGIATPRERYGRLLRG